MTITNRTVDSFEELDRKLKNLKFFARHFLMLRSKSGMQELFKFNRAQKHVHDKLEAQLKNHGKVRALVLKGRQQGCSTYVQARYFHKVLMEQGKKAFILTHENEATKNLFDITKRFYDKLPIGFFARAERSTAKELKFEELDSGYSIGTAGNKAVGRSQTIQLFHGSEVAFWQHAEDHSKGILQTISEDDGTEVILESTANGIGNYFHSIWQASIERKNNYQAIFVPWYWQDEYAVTDTDFKPSDEEERLLDLYGDDGLTQEHLAWRRLKISSFSNDEQAGRDHFKQEYPFSAAEAFLNPISNTFIGSNCVYKARNEQVYSESSKVVIGVDVAVGDGDKTAIIRRKGRAAYNLETFQNYNTMEIAGLLKHIIQKENPHKVYIDMIGIGQGVVDRLKEMGYRCVEGINVGRSANYKDKFKNLRAELWWEMREWLNGDMPVQIPDLDLLHSELTCLGYKYTSSGQLQLESKEELRNRGISSPDTADALALTFYSGQYEEDPQYEGVNWKVKEYNKHFT